MLRKPPPFSQEDETFMRRALELAREAAARDEVPVGALIVRDGKILSESYNLRETNRSATHHAEVLAIEEACRALGAWHLDGCTLYVTLEPCPMCAGAVVNARLSRVVFGAYDARAGAFGSLLDLTLYPLNHRPRADGGLLLGECRALMQEYFAQKRK